MEGVATVLVVAVIASAIVALVHRMVRGAINSVLDWLPGGAVPPARARRPR